MNITGRNNITKPTNVGAGLGGTSITNVGKNLVLTQSNVSNSHALKDALSIKSFKEKNPSNKNSSFEKMMLMDGFKQYNKIMFKPADAKISQKNNENDSQMSNVIKHTKPNGETQRILNSGVAKNMVTPGTLYKTNAVEINSDTNCSTMSKKANERPPSMRIKRSSSKKKKISNSNDSREKSAGVKILRKSDDFDQRKASAQHTKTANGASHNKYQKLSSKVDKPEAIDNSMWDRRFIEYTTKAKTYDLVPKPDVNYLK